MQHVALEGSISHGADLCQASESKRGSACSSTVSGMGIGPSAYPSIEIASFAT